MSRDPSAERSFAQRTIGVMKKANEVKNRFPDVKISVYISDGTKEIAYESDDNWPPEMGDIVAGIRTADRGRKRKQLYGPTDFITVSDAIRATSATPLNYATSCRPDEQGAQDSSTLDSASLSILENIAPLVPHPTEHSTPPPPKRARIMTRSATAKEGWDRYGFIKTGGDASQG
ncbi:hypothetical protein FGG08_000645 [Glutinoglossum americanum]|uniref:Uncharacterized protein n=1 Tax=Glutinoglossum americanum TaxID=1670608 RepID=A0A9P8IF53_9PEZI|nr:hypothetical protein FGG08_000645 [Glutinoglossum americanum]